MLYITIREWSVRPAVYKDEDLIFESNQNMRTYYPIWPNLDSIDWNDARA